MLVLCLVSWLYREGHTHLRCDPFSPTVLDERQVGFARHTDACPLLHEYSIAVAQNVTISSVGRALSYFYDNLCA